MDSMIKEINDNLKTIIDTIKDNLDNSISTLDNIQIQMDKKVEEAKKYKIQVDSAKEKIKSLEDENRSLELSLNELSEKYGKMNLVSLVEAGNREIKTKINDNLKEINKEKEHIADLTNKARTIKDLLINLKKDKTIKEDRLEHIKEVYSYYNIRINEIVDYAFDHSNNLSDYKNEVYVDYNEEIDEDVKNIELENTMVFDEIANIDDNRNFKDEMTFISNQIDDNINDEYAIDKEEVSYDDEIKEDDMNQIFDSIIDDSYDDDTQVEEKNIEEVKEDNNFKLEVNPFEEEMEEQSETSSINLYNDLEETINDTIEDSKEISEEDNKSLDGLVLNDNVVTEIVEDEESKLEVNPFEAEVEETIDTENKETETLDFYKDLNINQFMNQPIEEDKDIDVENEERISKINDLFSNFENNTINLETLGTAQNIENKIDDAYKDIFGKPLEEEDLNKKDPTLTDIFGNPISKDELSTETKVGKKIEEIFVENGIDFNKFREDEKNYLKQIYEEEKFNNILNTLKRNKINLDNIYNAFNIFGEITANELENLITKFVNIGQSVEAIGLILEKLPKVKKYNLDEAIISYGDYIKNIDITELVMKAKELYSNGGNN